MADQIIDNIPLSSSPSPFSLLNKLPTKRYDAAVTTAASAGPQEQGSQTGSYTAPYAHLSHLPLFPLYSDAQLALLDKAHARKDKQVQQMNATDPDKLWSGSQKAGFSALAALTGGASPVSAKRFERRLIGANVISANFTLSQNKLIVFTRWTVPGATTAWFVDVFEHRFLDPGGSKIKSGNGVGVKAGFAAPQGGKKEGKVGLRLLKTEAKGLKSQKVWTKMWNSEHCEAVALVGEDGVEVPMEIVARVQRTCSSVEALEMQKRFEKQWVVPVMY